MKSNLIIIANNNIGSSQSGGDTIFLELTKHWQKYLNITVIGSRETKRLLDRYKLKPPYIQTDTLNLRSYPSTLNIILHCFRRTYKAIFTLIKYKNIFKQSKFCYTASDFIPDFIFGLAYKLINPSGKWLCAQYLFAPKPNDKYSPYRTQPAKGLLYFLFQKFTKFFANKYADYIFITSKPDKKYFPHKKIIIVQGGVETKKSEKYLSSQNQKPINQRLYDAVFQGRLHSQKGVLELVDIWKLLIKQLPTAKLAIIGDGQLKKELVTKIKKYKLTNNITLFGFKSGQAKYKIFKNSKIVVHPAIYDSGGMAAAEAMAWGLPGVSFNLESLKSYYPQGMLKSRTYNFQIFADNIYKLLTNKRLYLTTSRQALDLIRSTWDWNIRSQIIYHQIFKTT